jgi:cytochrome P450
MDTVIASKAPVTPADLDDAIVDPRTYATPTLYDEIFADLRRRDPVHWTQPRGYRPFWTVTRYADIQAVEIDTRRFLNAPRLVLRSVAAEERVRALTGGRSLLLRNLVNMDGDEHQAYRRLTQGWFAPARLRLLEPELRAIARRYVDRMFAMGGACDFARDVAVWYPLHVIMHILGVPEADEPLMLKLTQQLFGPDDPDVKTAAPIDLVGVVDEFFAYFGKLTSERRAQPGDDVASLIANAEIDGQRIGDHEALSYYIIVATAGHDTTSSTIAGGLLALLQNPAQMARLRAEPELLPTAIDEMLRWVSPVKNFFRTAAEDGEVGGQAVRAGESLLMCYPSANRDEAVFDDPFRFDIARSPNRHLAFGYGPHVCLGMHLAKLEIRILLEELLPRIGTIELAGEPAWLNSNFVSGLKRLPIAYRAA